MGWTAGSDVSTGDLITAAAWNNYLGASGSLEYLKTEADKHDDVTHSEPTRALDTIYQNTSGKIKVVTVSVSLSKDTEESARILLGSGTPPATAIARLYHSSLVTGVEHLTATFIVPVDWYYEVESDVASPSLQDWHEWDLL